MRIIAIFAVLILSACGKTNDPKPCKALTFSAANPVEFWDINCDTFNETSVDGVFSKCFCQPFQCDDPIRVQFQEDTDSEFELKMYDDSGSLLHVFSFVNSFEDVWDLVFTPSDYSPDVCDKQVQLKIVELGNIVQNSSFDDSSNWANSGSGGSWSISAGAAVINFTGSGNSSKNFTNTLPASYIGLVKVVVVFNLSFLTASKICTVNINFGSNSVSFQVTAAGTYTKTMWITASAFSSVILSASTNDLTGTTKTLSVTDVKIISSSNETERAKSDCLNLKSTWKETKLINYYNANRNFAGLVYHDQTPDIQFYLRVPAIFFQERFPQETETIDLSNSRSIQIFSQQKAQKLLQVKEMPYYMHKKLILALQHQFVSIDDQTWVKKENYEVQESNPRWPLRKATVWLDQKNFIVRNVL